MLLKLEMKQQHSYGRIEKVRGQFTFLEIGVGIKHIAVLYFCVIWVVTYRGPNTSERGHLVGQLIGGVMCIKSR